MSLETEDDLKNKTDALEQCPVCRCEIFIPVFTAAGEQFVRCSDCGLLMINPRPIHSQVLDTYSHGYSQGYIAKKGSKLKRARRSAYLMKKFVMGGRWLDVGCSAGLMVLAAQEAGFDAYGMDVDDSGVGYACSRLGLSNVYKGYFEDQGFSDGYFNVISLYDVIEHVPDLNRSMAELKRILAPNGVIEIWTPDVSHWRRPKYLPDWDAIKPSEHLYYFDLSTLSLLLKRHKLKILKRRFSFKPSLKVYVGHD